jgi:signal transduction histidine kinase
MVVAFGWGIGLAVHGFVAVVAPELRERWVAADVGREVQSAELRERRVLGDRHARTMEKLSASVAHEIRNPITAAKSLVQQMGEDPSCADNVEYARVAIEELDRVERSIAHLLRYAREDECEIVDLRLAEVVESALASFRDRLEGVELVSDLSEDDAMRGDPNMLRRVVINLMSNALDALGEARTEAPKITIRSGQNLAGTELWLRVRDNGPGVDPALAEEIFSPFHSGKDGGTGLGLAIARKLVVAHGGTVELGEPAGAGTEFVVVFPRAATGTELGS